MVNGAERKMYDSLGPLLVMLRYKSKAKSDMVKWSQGGVLLVVSAWTDATSRTHQPTTPTAWAVFFPPNHQKPHSTSLTIIDDIETKSAITMKAPLPVDMKAF